MTSTDSRPRGLACASLSPSRRWGGLQPRGGRSICQAIAIILLLSACASKPEATARTSAFCEAMAPAMPVLFHGKADTPDTIARIKAANARYEAACG